MQVDNNNLKSSSETIFGSRGSSASPKRYSDSSSFQLLEAHGSEFGSLASNSPRFGGESVSEDPKMVGSTSSYVVREPEGPIENYSIPCDYHPEDFGRQRMYPNESSQVHYSRDLARSYEYNSRGKNPHSMYNPSLHINCPQEPSQYSQSYTSGPYTAPARNTARRTGSMSHSSSFRIAPAVHSDDAYRHNQYYDQPLSTPSYSNQDTYGYSPLRTPSSTTWPSGSHSGSFSGKATQSHSSSNHSSKGRTLDPIDGYIYQVQFKRAHRNFVLAPSAPRDIIPGDFVKVEADRGEDMGIVLAKIPVDSFEEVIPTAGYRGRGFSSGQGERKYLYRLATADERNTLASKVADEERALQTVRDKAIERCLPMKVLDAEYQFDRHKLTFYFEADKRIDFRDLVSELFSQYKTRIWMQQVDTSTLPLHDSGTELAKATGFLPNRDDETILGRTPSYGSAASFETTKFDGPSTTADSHYFSGYAAKTDDKKAFTSSVFPDPWGQYRF